MSSIWDKGVMNYFGVPASFEPVSSTSASVTDFLYFPDRISYSPEERVRVPCGVCVQVKRVRTTTWYIFIVTKETVERTIWCIVPG